MSRQLMNTVYLVLVGEVIAIAAFTLSVFMPMVQEINIQRKELIAVEQTLEDRRQFLQSIDRKRVDLEQKQADEQLLAVALPSDDDMDTITRLLHRASETSGATILRVNNVSDVAQREATTQRAQGEAVAIPTQVTPLSIETTIRGSYQQIRVFLEQVEQSPRLMDVEEMELKRSVETPEPLNADFIIQLYKQEKRK